MSNIDYLMNDNNKLPNQLFVYMNYQSAFEFLMTRQLRFSSFEAFNDPFEIIPQSSFTNIISNKSPQVILRDIKQYLDEHPDDFTPDEIQGIGSLAVGAAGAAGLVGLSLLPVVGLIALGLGVYALGKDAEKKEKNLDANEKKRIQEKNEEKKKLHFFYDLIKNYLSKTQVCCMSAQKDSVLMWSHYGRKHTGMVFSFDTKDQCWKENGCEFVKVEYKAERVAIPVSDDIHKNEIVNMLISTKSNEWKYEKEWRLIKRDCTEPFSLKVNNSTLKGVYLGVRVSPENTAIIYEVVKKMYAGTELYKAKLHNSQYKLIFDKIKDK